MLNFNPSNRPNAVQCLQHPFFQCYEVLRFYGIKFNTKEDTNDDKKEIIVTFKSGNQIAETYFLSKFRKNT